MWADIQEILARLWANTQVLAGIIAVGSMAAAYLVEFLFHRTFTAMAARTKTNLDDKIAALLRGPIFWTVILVGLAWATSVGVTSGSYIVYGVLKTLAVLIWTVAFIRMGEVLLASVAARSREGAVVQPRTLPIFDMLTKIVVISAACYFTFLAWEINVSAWLASAGIVGIAVGFAAKDTLANLFAGIFILADNIYRVGDFIVLSEDGLRGRVTRIGMRSTRILTLEEVEITIPNAVIGNSKLINEMAGPSVRQRIRATVFVAVGSDVDRVFEVLRASAEGIQGVCAQPPPEVRFRAFGDGRLEFELWVFIIEAAERDRIISRLNTSMYKALGAAGIEIPYRKHDVYIKEMPGAK